MAAAESRKWHGQFGIATGYQWELARSSKETTLKTTLSFRFRVKRRIDNLFRDVFYRRALSKPTEHDDLSRMILYPGAMLSFTTVKSRTKYSDVFINGWSNVMESYR